MDEPLDHDAPPPDDEAPRDVVTDLLERAALAVTLSDEAGAWTGYAAAADATAVDPAARALHARALAGLAGIAVSRGQRVAAADLVVRAIDAVETLPEPDPLATVDVRIAASEVAINARSAVREAHLAVAAASAIPDDKTRLAAETRALRTLGGAFRVAGRYGTAERILTRAAAAAERSGAPIDAAGVLNDLGVVLKFAGRFEEADRLYARVGEILDGAGLGESADRATLLHNLGGLLHAQGRQVEAEPFARQSVELHARTLGPEHHATDLDRVALASILDQLGRPDEAEGVLLEALPRLRSRLGRDREVAVALTNLGAICQRSGRLAEAEAAYREALAIKEETLGPRTPALAATLNNLATVLRRRGRVDDARDLYRRALDLLDGTVAADHPMRRTIEANLGRLDGLEASPGGPLRP